jgi:hypothetical protein
VFVSVDPLVTKTMQPYIYGAANPIRFSDPAGLEPRPIHNPNYDPDTAGPDPYASGCGGYGCGSYVPDNQQGPLAPNQGRARPGWRPPSVSQPAPPSGCTMPNSSLCSNSKAAPLPLPFGHDGGTSFFQYVIVGGGQVGPRRYLEAARVGRRIG